MTESEFKALMLLARATPGRYSDGYQRGLRRLRHGERFGTIAEHEKWISLDDERGDGYRDGLTGEPPAGAKTCSVPDCPRRSRARGMCARHYGIARVAGELPDVAVQRKDLVRLDLRLPPEVIAAIDAEAANTSESRYAVARRWLTERAER